MTAAASEEMEQYPNIFNDLNHDWEPIVDQRDTEKEVAFIEDVLDERGPVLDLCCGTGRHSIIMSQHGWNIIGLDLSRNLLAIAKKRMEQNKADFPLIRADMRCFPFRNRVFKGVFNMFTSFGYLPSDTDDLKCLNEVQRVLKDHGLFLIDVVNKEYVMKIYKERDWAEYEPFYLLESRVIDTRKSMLLSEWTIIGKGTNEIRHVQHNLRLYSLPKLRRLLHKANLRIKRVYGGYDKKEFSRDASRMILLAQKTGKKQVRNLN